MRFHSCSGNGNKNHMDMLCGFSTECETEYNLMRVNIVDSRKAMCWGVKLYMQLLVISRDHFHKLVMQGTICHKNAARRVDDSARS